MTTNYKTAHVVRHPLTGLYFKPEAYPNLVSLERAKIYKTNNDIISFCGGLPIDLTLKEKDFLELIKPKLDSFKLVMGTEHSNFAVYETFDGQRIKVWDGRTCNINCRPSHLERIPVKLTVTIDM